MIKIVQLVENCQPCPNRMYNSGVYRCQKKDGYNDLPEDHRKRMPGWCPLVDYPTAAARGVKEDGDAHA